MTLNHKKALIIYNPVAGTAHDIDICLGATIHKLCEQATYIAEVFATQPSLLINEILKARVGSIDLIVVIGGDGTIAEVLGAVHEAKFDIPVGIIPFGTGNQLARNLGIFEENILVDPLEIALNIILAGKTRLIDLGLMNGHYFCVAAGAGPLSDAVTMPTPKEKANLKMFAYVGSIIQTFAVRPVVFQVTADDDRFIVSASGIFVTNVADLGVGTLSNTAETNDGLLDLCILTPTEFVDYLQLGFRFAAGFLGGQAPYYIRKVKKVKIEVMPLTSPLSHLQNLAHKVRTIISGGANEINEIPQQVMAMIDGDTCGSTPMNISIVASAVSIITP